MIIERSISDIKFWFNLSTRSKTNVFTVIYNYASIVFSALKKEQLELNLSTQEIGFRE